MVVADRIELSLTAYQTVFLPLKEATKCGAQPPPAGFVPGVPWLNVSGDGPLSSIIVGDLQEELDPATSF